MTVSELLVKRKDVTSIQVKVKTRAKLDKLGDIHRETYDDIVQRLILQQGKPKNEGINYMVDTIVEDYKDIRYRLQMEDDDPKTTILADEVMTMLGHYLGVAEKSGVPLRWNEIEIPQPKSLEKKREVIQNE